MKNLLVLFGGKSNEHEVSLLSAVNVCNNVDKSRYNLIKVGITKNGTWKLYTGEVEKLPNGLWEKDIENQKPVTISTNTEMRALIVFDTKSTTYELIPIDVAFPVLHGRNGEDGTIQGLLTVGGIPFVGCDTYSSAVCMNKAATKILSEQNGVKSTPYVVVSKNDKDKAIELVDSKNLEYPVFVKPQSGGSSVGITKVKMPSELNAALDFAFENDCDGIALIEQGVIGKEIEVALLGDEEGLIVSPCGEIEPGSEFYDYDNKYNDDTAKYYAPARIDDAIAEKVRQLGCTVFRSCGCRGLARCDFFVTDKGEILLNEINTIPGFTQISMYSKLLSLAGISTEKIIDTLVEIALKRA